MDNRVLDVYFQEIETQASFALNAISGLNSVLGRLPDDEQTLDGERTRILRQEIFRSIHSFLTHASNLSRLLWPASPPRRTGEGRADYQRRCAVDSRVQRGNALRSALGLAEHGHPLRSRRMRDHLEHFDERLDEWQATSARRNYLQDNIGPIGSLPGFDVTDSMRWYDPATKMIWFRGEQHDLQAYATAVEQVQGTVRAASRRRRAEVAAARPNKPLQPTNGTES